jgi:predicted dehydrogenase
VALRAIVIGTGWAGEGHSLALRAAEVDVVALCGRTPEPTHELAQRLGIPAVRFDWRSTIQEFQPDIVTITTPAAPHREMAIAAAEAGSHVVCEKPLGVNATEAREMLAMVERRGVKHAYGATGCYAPPLRYVRRMRQDSVHLSVHRPMRT